MAYAGNDIASAIREALDEYGDDIGEAIHEAGKLTAKELADKIKGSHPGFNNKKYLQGWTSKETDSSKLSFKYVVHNKRHYRLAHLLEYGHAKRNGGRTRAFPHIAPVEEIIFREIGPRLIRL